MVFRLSKFYNMHDIVVGLVINCRLFKIVAKCFAIVCLAAIVVTLFLVWRMASSKGIAGGKRLTVQVVHGDGGSDVRG